MTPRTILETVPLKGFHIWGTGLLAPQCGHTFADELTFALQVRQGLKDIVSRPNIYRYLWFQSLETANTQFAPRSRFPAVERGWNPLLVVVPLMWLPVQEWC